MDLIHKIESLRYDIENGVETDVINISVRLIQIREQALQLLQTGVMQSVFKVMAGNSELERFKSREKAEEICEYYRGNGFPNARVEETVV